MGEFYAQPEISVSGLGLAYQVDSGWTVESGSRSQSAVSRVQSEAMRMGTQGHEKLPEWENWLDKFVLGLMGAIISVITV